MRGQALDFEVNEKIKKLKAPDTILEPNRRKG